MNKGFLRTSISSILDELHSHRFMVGVPYIALMSETELAPDEEDIEFLDGVPIRKLNIRNGTSKDTYSKLEPSVTNNVVNKDSLNDMKNVYLPLANIIDLFNNGYSVRTVNRDDVGRIVNILTPCLNDLEAIAEYGRVKNADEVYEYINDFYLNMIKINSNNIKNSINKVSNSGMILGLGNGFSAMDGVKSNGVKSSSSVIDVDSLLVN